MSQGLEVTTAGEQIAITRQITEAEVDMQVATAKRFPRSLDKCIKDAKTMATKTQEIAASCFYRLPRRDKNGKRINILGPSIRLAEILLSTWGNIRAEARAIEEGARHVTAQATVWDMERNVLVRQEGHRRIVDRNGKRYNDDMIMMTINAAISINLRNATFRVIPRSVVDEVYNEARSVAIGDQRTLDERRQQMVEAYMKMGIDEDRILVHLGRRSLIEVNLDDLEDLIGMYTAIRDGMLSIDNAFPQAEEQTKKNGKSKQQESVTQRAIDALNGQNKKQVDANSDAPTQRQSEKKQPGPTLDDLRARAHNLGVPDRMFRDWLEEIGFKLEDKRTHTDMRLNRLADYIEGWKLEREKEEVSNEQ